MEEAMKILIVDDSRAMRMIVRRTLRQAGFKNLEISEAADGRDALNKVLVSPPDLILSDWNMPVMDGMAFLTELRAQFNTPFCFVTAQGSAEMRERARMAGANFLISKPFTPDTFAEILGRFMD
jgi:two-component system chemotaxis response regulator CheY